MHRCRVEPESWGRPDLTPSPGELERLLKVLRLGHGDPVAVFDGRGRSGCARLQFDSAAKTARLAVCEESVAADQDAALPLPVWLFQAVPRATRMDWLVEKAVELGVAAIHPLLTERGLVRPQACPGGNRLHRWRRIAQQAARQCGLAVVPAVEMPLTIGEALSLTGNRCTGGMYGSLEPGAVPLRRAFEALKNHRQLAVFIGPEGDFSPSEHSALRAAGLVPITLGPRVLRVETAAIAALCLLGDACRTQGIKPS